MSWTTITRLSLAGLTLVGVAAFCSLDFHYEESSVSLKPLGLTVTVNRSWGNRTLTLENDLGEAVEQHLLSEWGPVLRTNIYETAEGGLSLIDFDGSWVIRQSPLRLEQTFPSDDWKYVGTLLRIGYRAAQEVDECIDILMDEPPPAVRSWAYRRSC